MTTKKIHVAGKVPYIGQVCRILCGEHRYRVEVNPLSENLSRVAVSLTVIGDGKRYTALKDRLDATGWAYRYNDGTDKPKTGTDYRSFVVEADVVLSGN